MALETVSIPGFVMAGLRKRDLYSSEAAIKFFLIGVLSVALMLFGISMMYGFTGTTSLTGIAQALGQWGGVASPPLLLSSLLLIIVGFGFKISAVPFHFWAPDTYAGSPIPVAAMLAVASKTAGFAGLIAVTFIAFEPFAEVWAPALGVLAILTMSLGNLVALQQRDMVRLLAWSSVSQAGYMLIPFGWRPFRRGRRQRGGRPGHGVLHRGLHPAQHRGLRRPGRGQPSDRVPLGRGLRGPGVTPSVHGHGDDDLPAVPGRRTPPTVGLWAKFAIVQAGAGPAPPGC